MAILVSPGVDIQVIDESIYATGGIGTVPLVIFATGENKARGDNSGIAEGTLAQNSGKLYLLTSQRDITQTFGTPRYYTVQGTSIHGHELNEHGLLALYSYLGIQNRAYAIRANINTDQLVPSIYAPRAPAKNGTYWLDLNETRWGTFVSNGNSVPGLAFKNRNPIVVDRKYEMELAIYASVMWNSSTTPVLTAPGTYTIKINGQQISVVHSGVNKTLADVVTAINTAAIPNISARIARKSGKSFVILTNNSVDGTLFIEPGTGTSLVTILGMNQPIIKQPNRSLGQEGDLSVMVIDRDNILFQKLTPKDDFGNLDANAISLWFMVGSNAWKAARPTVAKGSITPTLPLQNGDKLIFGTTQTNMTIEYVVSGSPGSIAAVVSALQGIIVNARNGLAQDGVTPLVGGAKDLPINVWQDGGAIVLTNSAGTGLRFSEPTTNSTQGIVGRLGLPIGTVKGNEIYYSPHTQIPRNSAVGDIWVKTTEPNLGSRYIVKRYNSSTKRWNVLTSTLFRNDDDASLKLGINAIAGTLYTSYNLYGTDTNPLGSSSTKRYLGPNNTLIQGTKTPGVGSVGPLKVGDKFVLGVTTINNTNSYVINYTMIDLPPSVGDINGNVSLAGLSATINDVAALIPGINSRVVNDVIEIYNTNKLTVSIGYFNPLTNSNVPNAIGRDPLSLLGIEAGTYSNWEFLSYEPSTIAPTTDPADGTLWYNTDFRVDMLVNDLNQGDEWLGYKNVYPDTDPKGVIIGGSAPLTQTDGTPLVENDLWIDGTDLENYPKLYRYRVVEQTWESIDITDQTTPFGIVFADARYTSNGKLDGSQRIEDMLTSDYLDPDAPDPRTYPGGMLLFNTRYSTYNVKVWRPRHLSGYIGQELEDSPGMQYSVGFRDFPVDTIEFANMGRWVTASGNQTNGSPWMGRKAQRQMIVRALQSVVIANQDIRAESVFFNILATPGYPELIDEMVTLNVDKKEIAFIVGDTPARLRPTGTDIQAWATNSNNAPSNGDVGLTTRNTYIGLYYPWGLGTNLDGMEVMIPPSNIALRTLAYNDTVAYPWFAPAGFARGIVTNAASVGYLTSENEYQPVQLNQGQRDVLYVNSINPIAFIPGRGLVVYGQKTLHPINSALDRVNVVRLINYMRYNLDIIAKPFLFEPNDKITRDEVKTVMDRFLGGLVSLRALYDFAVRCDEGNNTPERIDRNELWIDLAIKPVKAIEFIYIPIRVRNTGDSLSFA